MTPGIVSVGDLLSSSNQTNKFNQNDNVIA